MQYPEDDLTRLKVYYKLSSSKYWKMFNDNTAIPSDDGWMLYVSQTVNTQGDYQVRVALDDATLECSLSAR